MPDSSSGFSGNKLASGFPRISRSQFAKKITPVISIISHHSKIAMELPFSKYTRSHINTETKLTAIHNSHCSIHRFTVRVIAATEKTVVEESTNACAPPRRRKISAYTTIATAQQRTSTILPRQSKRFLITQSHSSICFFQHAIPRNIIGR